MLLVRNGRITSSEDFAWYLLILGEISRRNRCHCCCWIVSCRYPAQGTLTRHTQIPLPSNLSTSAFVSLKYRSQAKLLQAIAMHLWLRLSQLILVLRCGRTPHLGCRQRPTFAGFRSQLPGDAGSEPSGFFVGVCPSLFLIHRACRILI